MSQPLIAIAMSESKADMFSSSPIHFLTQERTLSEKVNKPSPRVSVLNEPTLLSLIFSMDMCRMEFAPHNLAVKVQRLNNAELYELTILHRLETPG